METREVLLERLNQTVAQVLELYRHLANPELIVYEGWTAPDILGHLVFWHESFARNVHDLVHDIPPTPLKGRLRDLNQQGVEAMRPYALDRVIQRLEIAHETIQQNILNPRLTLIPYRQGSRDYTPEEHLDLVHKHMTGHLKGIQAALTKAKKHQ